MKKFVFLTILQLVVSVSFAQIKTPSTYRFTKKVFGEPTIEQVTSYFIFSGANTVIWCIESHDGYIFPAAVGSFNLTTHKIVFPEKEYTAAKNGQIDLTISMKNGRIEISSNNEDFYFISDEGVMLLSECDYSLTPSNKLIGSSWKSEDFGEKCILYFKSKTEVLLDGEPRLYIAIGQTVGILAGDNFEEVGVGEWGEQFLYFHGSGVVKKDSPYQTFKRMN